jgi:hypothetical protein
LIAAGRYASTRRRRHKKLTDWGRRVLLQTARWLPERDIIAAADSCYAVIDLLNAVRRSIRISPGCVWMRGCSIHRPHVAPAPSADPV